jgi:dienelactone hydrolase
MTLVVAAPQQRVRIRPHAWGALTMAVAMGVLVGRDGAPVWQVVRAAIVATMADFVLRRLRRGDGVLAVLAGGTAMITGGAIGGSHLVKNGSGLATAAGLAALLAGVAVFSQGLANLRAGRGRRQRILRSVLAVLATAVAGWILAPAVLATNVPATALGRDTPADRGFPHEDVTFTTSDGVRLSAWYIPSRNGAAVVFRHGAGSTRSNVLDQAIVVAAAGYGTLLVDARGHGESGGRAMDFGWHGTRDLTAALSWVERQPGVDPERIAVLGLSMGGEEAIGAMGADRRIAAVVAEGATGRTDADKRWFSRAFGWRGWMQERLEWVTYTTTDLLTSAGKPVPLATAVNAAPRTPILLIAAGQIGDERRVAADLAAHSEAAVTWVVSGAGHTDALATRPAEWRKRVVDFLDRALQPDRPGS